MSRQRWLQRPDGTRLAWHLRSGGGRRLALVTHGLFCHRTMEELERLERSLADAGWDVALWDVRGHGDSGGRFTFGVEEPHDLAAMVEEARREAPYEECVGIGFSFGAFSSMMAAAQGAALDRLVLVAGPKDFRGLSPALFGGHFLKTMRYRLGRPLRRTRFGVPLRARRFPIDVVADLDAPLYFVHGTDDWIVPLRHSRLLCERAQRAELTVIEGGLHAEYLLAQMPDRLIALLLDWMGPAAGPGGG